MSLLLPVAESLDDWTTYWIDGVLQSTVTTGLALEIWSDKQILGSHQAKVGYADIDTSVIKGKILKAKFHWYDAGQRVTRGLAQSRLIYLAGHTIFNSAATIAAGWRETDLLPQAVIDAISTTGNTRIQFDTAEVLDGEFRQWEVRAWDYLPTGDFACYLEVWVAGGRRYRVRCA